MDERTVVQDVHGLDDLADASHSGCGITEPGHVIEDSVEVVEDTGRELDSCQARGSGQKLVRGPSEQSHRG